jgi:hypothetical protein
MEENKEKKNNEGTENLDTQGGKEFDIEGILNHPEFKKYMDSYADKRVSDAIKTNEKKLKTKFEEEKKKSDMTQEELLLQKENELRDRELKLEKIQYFKDKQYDLDLLDFVIGGDIEAIKEKSDLLISNINKVVEKQVNERFKGGYVPPKNDDSKNKQVDSIGLKLAKQVDESQKRAIDSQSQYFK